MGVCLISLFIDELSQNYAAGVWGGTGVAHFILFLFHLKLTSGQLITP